MLSKQDFWTSYLPKPTLESGNIKKKLIVLKLAPKRGDWFFSSFFRTQHCQHSSRRSLGASLPLGKFQSHHSFIPFPFRANGNNEILFVSIVWLTLVRNFLISKLIRFEIPNRVRPVFFLEHRLSFLFINGFCALGSSS